MAAATQAYLKPPRRKTATKNDPISQSEAPISRAESRTVAGRNGAGRYTSAGANMIGNVGETFDAGGQGLQGFGTSAPPELRNPDWIEASLQVLENIVEGVLPWAPRFFKLGVGSWLWESITIYGGKMKRRWIFNQAQGL